MTGPAGPGPAPDPEGGRAEGSVEWLHALVPGAEELDLFEELDAAREREEWADRSHLQGFAELLAELFDGQKVTLDDVVEVLRRSGHLPAPGGEAAPQRTAGGAGSGQPEDQAQDGGAGDDEPATGTVSSGQAAEVIAHLLGGHLVADDDVRARERGGDEPEGLEDDTAANG